MALILSDVNLTILGTSMSTTPISARLTKCGALLPEKYLW